MIRFIWIFPALFLAHSASAQSGSLDLSKALSLARSNRATVVAAEQRVVSAKAMRKSLAAFPATRLSLGYTSPIEAGGSDDDLVISQPIDLFGRRSASASLGDAGILRAEADLRKTLSELQFEVIEEFSAAATAQALATSAEQTKDIAQQLYDAIATLVEEGRTPGVELARVRIELERARLKERQRTAELKSSLERLAALIAMPTDQVEVKEFAQIEIPTGRTHDGPDLLILSSEVSRAEAEERVARLINAPDLEVQARRSAWQDRDAKVGARIQLSFPLYDDGRSRAERNAAQATTLATRKSLEDATRIAQAELRSSQVELVAAQEQITGYEAIVETARLLVERSRAGYTDRAVTLIELLEATRALREVEESFVEAKHRLALSQAKYLRANGTILEVSK